MEELGMVPEVSICSVINGKIEIGKKDYVEFGLWNLGIGFQFLTPWEN